MRKIFYDSNTDTEGTEQTVRIRASTDRREIVVDNCLVVDHKKLSITKKLVVKLVIDN